jgi:hypothetical protein
MVGMTVYAGIERITVLSSFTLFVWQTSQIEAISGAGTLFSG